MVGTVVLVAMGVFVINGVDVAVGSGMGVSVGMTVWVGMAVRVLATMVALSDWIVAFTSGVGAAGVAGAQAARNVLMMNRTNSIFFIFLLIVNLKSDIASKKPRKSAGLFETRVLVLLPGNFKKLADCFAQHALGHCADLPVNNLAICY